MPRALLFPVFIFGMLLLVSCEQPTEPDLNNPYDPESPSFRTTPDITTAPVIEIGALQAVSGGSFQNDFGLPPTAKGVCWSTSQSPGLSDSCTDEGPGMNSFTSQLTNLQPGTTYFVRAYSTNPEETVFGNERTFTTTDGPALEVFPPTTITAVSVGLSGEITGDGVTPIQETGLCIAREDDEDNEQCVPSGTLEKVPVEELLRGQHGDFGNLDARKRGLKSASEKYADETAKVLPEGESEQFELEVTELQPDTRYTYAAYAISGNLKLRSEALTFGTRDGIARFSEITVSDVRFDRARAEVFITDDGGASISVRGFCIRETDGTPQNVDDCTSVDGGVGTFSSAFSSLENDTPYFVTAYAQNDAGLFFSETKSFRTDLGLPVLGGASLAEVMATSVRVEDSVADEGIGSVSDRGACLSSTGDFDDEEVICENASGTGSDFEVMFSGLEPDTRYFIRTFAENQAGTAFGDTLVADTRSGAIRFGASMLESFNHSSAQLRGEIQNDGGSAVSLRGFCYSDTSSEPDADDTCVDSGTGDGLFTITIDGLEIETSYYARAFAENETGRYYSADILNFTTLDGFAVLEEARVDSVRAQWILVSAGISDTGLGSLEAFGLCISTSPEPTIDDRCVLAEPASSPDAFTLPIDSLQPNTGYHIRAFAENERGTSYGEATQVQTRSGVVTFNLLTFPQIEHDRIRVETSVADDGGSDITTSGICKSADNTSPDLNDNCTSGSSTSTILALFTDLDPDTQYYFRAYAENETGTYFGNQRSVTTLDGTPILSEVSVSDISAREATLEAEVLSSPATVTNRGFCYSDAPGVGLSDTCINTGDGTGSFTALLEDLDAQTDFYVIAFAENSFGTAVTNEVNFQTTSVCPTETITDIDGNVYNVVGIGNQCWMAENLRTSRYRGGSQITRADNASLWGSMEVGAWTWYNNDENLEEIAGKLYNFYAAYNGFICPTGWSVPTDADWQELERHLGMPESELGIDGERGEAQNIGGKLKENSSAGWSVRLNHTNESGFTARGGGQRFGENWRFTGFQTRGYFWTRTMGAGGIYRMVAGGAAYVERGGREFEAGHSIRCIAN